MFLHRLIQQAVVRHGHVGRGGQLQPRDVDVIGDEHVQLTEHHLRIHDRAGSDQADRVRVKDSGRDQMKLQHTVVNDDRVPCIHTALVAHHHIGGATEEIGDLSLSFVTPLSSDDDNVGQ